MENNFSRWYDKPLKQRRAYAKKVEETEEQSPIVDRPPPHASQFLLPVDDEGNEYS